MSICKFPSQTQNDTYPFVPEELKARPQWVCWRLEKRSKDDDKPTKIPYSPRTGVRARADVPDTWSSYLDALKALQRDSSYAGIGYEFARDDDYTGIDLDNCVHPQTGEIAPWALDVINTLGSYTEYSPSGTGLHIIVKAKLPGGGHNDQKNGREMYDHGRFFTVTGKRVTGTPEAIEERQAEAELLYREWWPDRPKPDRVSPALPSDLSLSDSELIDKARAAKNGRQFEALLSGHWESYASQSDADLALCNHLAFWTGCDPERMDRLFRKSGLMRDKWDERRGERGAYGQITIATAIDSTGEGYTGHRPASERIPPIEEVPLECYAEEYLNHEPAVNQDEKEAVQEVQRPSSKFRFVRVGEMSVSAPKWRIKGILEQESIHVLFGDPKSGKSFVAIDQGLCIATGTEWHGHPVKQGPVFYIAGEGHGGLARRAMGWSIHHGIDIGEVPFFFSNRSVPICDAESVIELTSVIDEMVAETGFSPAAISIDTLARNFGADENSTQDMNLFISNVDIYLRCRYKAAITIVHHSGNSDKSRGRGSSVLRGALDGEFQVSRNERLITLAHLNSKDGPLHEAMYFNLETVNIGLADEDGEPVDGVALTLADGPPIEEPPTKGLGRTQRRMLNELIAMHEQAAARLAARGEDRETIIEIEGWRQACLEKGIVGKTHFEESLNGLLKRGAIVIKNDIHVRPGVTE